MGEVRDSIALKPLGGRGGVWGTGLWGLAGLGSWLCGFFFVGVTVEDGWMDGWRLARSAWVSSDNSRWGLSVR